MYTPPSSFRLLLQVNTPFPQCPARQRLPSRRPLIPRVAPDWAHDQGGTLRAMALVADYIPV